MPFKELNEGQTHFCHHTDSHRNEAGICDMCMWGNDTPPINSMTKEQKLEILFEKMCEDVAYNHRLSKAYLLELKKIML